MSPSATSGTLPLASNATARANPRSLLFALLLPLLILVPLTGCDAEDPLAGPGPGDLDELLLPGTGSDLEAAAPRTRSVELSFTEVDDGLGEPALYEIRYSENGFTGKWENAPLVSEGSCAPPLQGSEIGSTLTCIVRGLEPSTAYAFQLAAYREDPGNGRAVYGRLSNVASVETAERDDEGELALSPAQYTFPDVDMEIVLELEAFDDQGQAVDDPRVAWATSDPDVATVDEDGVVTSIGPGEATITVSAVCCAVTQKARINVRHTVARIALSPTTFSLAPGDTRTVTATPEDQRGRTVNSATIAWSSSNPLVATVNSSGVVRGVAAGQATIRASAGTISADATVTVTAAAPPPPSGNNEPSGYSRITSRPFDAVVEAGWANNGSSHFTIVRDNTAPRSCCNVGRARYPAGFKGGVGPVRTWYGLPSGNNELFLSFWVKFSDNWQGHGSGVNKILFVWIHSDPSVVISATGGGSGPLRPQFRLQNIPDGARNLSANVRNVEIQRGKWHHYEAQIISNTNGARNGVARMWIDGSLVMDHRDVNYAGSNQARTWQSVYWNPTWGGTGDVVQQEMYMWMDDLYVSGRR